MKKKKLQRKQGRPREMVETLVLGDAQYTFFIAVSLTIP